jgi:prepilin-type N-terminal cleavage/methylation domain-containing protein
MFTSRNTSVNRNRGTRPAIGPQAFTLLEVTLAMGILVLLAGALYAMVDASLRGTAELEARENRTRQYSEFLALCRKTLRSLPATSLFQARVVEQNGTYQQELIFRNAPGIFWWGSADNASLSTILGSRPQIGGLVSVGILQDTEDEMNSYLKGGAPSQPWLLLLKDLRSAEWRFLDPRIGSWVKEWKDPSFRPAFAELTLGMGNGTDRIVFWMPPLQRPQSPQ